MQKKKLNLVDPNSSEIAYTPMQFPDGQQSIEIIDRVNLNNVEIVSRLNSFKDLELIVCATAALKKIVSGHISLYVPYFLGARSDRKFSEGSIHYIKDVISPILNLQNYHSVTVLDPHSDVLEACINNLNKLNNIDLVRFALTDIDNRNDAQERICLVSPDAGAYKKIFDVARHFSINNIITATKVRDLRTGKILRTEIPQLDQHNDLKYVIVDDICDGGRTFVELAKAIKGSCPTAKVYLIVTHGIFSAGYAQLGELVEQIYTTNSIKDIGETEYPFLEVVPTKVKQLNIF